MCEITTAVPFLTQLVIKCLLWLKIHFFLQSLKFILHCKNASYMQNINSVLVNVYLTYILWLVIKIIMSHSLQYFDGFNAYGSKKMVALFNFIYSGRQLNADCHGGAGGYFNLPYIAVIRSAD